MSLNFPSSPALDALYTLGTRTWKFNGEGWEVVPPQGELGYTGSKGDIGYTGSQGSSASINFVTRNYTGNGSNTTFTITNGLTVNSVFVFENGIMQFPTTDYTVSGTNLIFVTAPTTNMAIQIREIIISGSGGSGGSGGTSNAAIAGYNLVFGG
jgi:hypothetical protein